MKENAAEWKRKQLTEQWNVKFSKDAAAEEDFKTELKSTKNCNTINATFSFEYYNKLEIEDLVTEERILQYKDGFEARKTLQ